MFILLLILGLLWPTQHLAPATMSGRYHSNPVHHVIVIPKPVETAPVTVQPVKQNIPPRVVTPAPVLVQPTIPKPPVISTPQNTSAKCYSNCTDPNRPYYDQWGNEFDYMGNLIQVGNCSVQQPPINGPNPYCTGNNSCAPTATVQDPCKLGKCFGYPYGVCESNPNQGELTK